MRLQALLHGGPFDGQLTTMTSIGNETPVELRLADLASEIDTDNKVTAHLYRLIGEETYEAARTTFVSFQYLRDIESAIGLVDHWIGKV